MGGDGFSERVQRHFGQHWNVKTNIVFFPARCHLLTFQRCCHCFPESRARFKGICVFFSVVRTRFCKFKADSQIRILIADSCGNSFVLRWSHGPTRKRGESLFIFLVLNVTPPYFTVPGFICLIKIGHLNVRRSSRSHLLINYQVKGIPTGEQATSHLSINSIVLNILSFERRRSPS